MMKRFGNKAAKEPDERANCLFEKGEPDGAVVWCRIRDVIIQSDATGQLNGEEQR